MLINSKLNTFNVPSSPYLMCVCAFFPSPFCFGRIKFYHTILYTNTKKKNQDDIFIASHMNEQRAQQHYEAKQNKAKHRETDTNDEMKRNWSSLWNIHSTVTALQRTTQTNFIRSGILYFKSKAKQKQNHAKSSKRNTYNHIHTSDMHLSTKIAICTSNRIAIINTVCARMVVLGFLCACAWRCAADCRV